mmetsp:Transcript_63142/g.170357  ORF Transcript_63142/g.170357 Transcript_63142/m.170357 type:complete len:198 (-) Transcript_63142:216-809(-)
MFTPKNFYSCGFLLLVVVLLWCMLLAMQCPYAAKCKVVYYLCLVTAAVAGGAGAMMGLIGYSIGHVNALQDQDLTPQKMTQVTKRWGYVARMCPKFSRVLFCIVGLASVAGLAAAHTTCPQAGAPEWEGQWCQHTSKSPSPLMDFGLVVGLWAAVAVCGNRIKPSTTLPFLFEANSEISDGKKPARALSSCAKCMHP